MEADDLDISWIEEQERIQNIQASYSREPIESITTYFIYINRNQYIDKIYCENQILQIKQDKSGSFISQETVLKIIQSKKKTTVFSKYKLIDILLYNVDLDPERIQDYSNDTFENNSTLKPVPIFDEIFITPSIFIFHSINSLYFVFQEVEIEKVHNNRRSLKSILKLHKIPTITKKVRIQDDSIEYSSNYRNRIKKTRKNIKVTHIE
uniref:Uncharacterized protein n=1 Tax=viral metagenome TaxID=1070528 RepID=A0A6C0JJD7_9ZZZZ